ncbi:MAG TPA: WYL domain-containing protein, partial [Anaerolineales bacterium]|nr:WYL domain-containing protein [Anaerolineales bacterium]
GERESERDVEVFGLVHHWGRWYLLGHCHLRRAVRVFRVDRIVSAAVTERPARKRRPGNVLEVVLSRLALGGPGHAVEVLLKTSLAQARDRVPQGAALLDEVHGGVQLRA